MLLKLIARRILVAVVVKVAVEEVIYRLRRKQTFRGNPPRSFKPTNKGNTSDHGYLP